MRPAVVTALALVTFAALPARSQDKLNYARDIQPILSENCFACHGFDEKARKAKLRLDTEAGATAKHKDHTPIVPGHPDQSDVIRRILTADPDDHMPPEDSGKKLTARQIDLIKLWMDDGFGDIPKLMPYDISRAVIDQAHKDGLKAVGHVYYRDSAEEMVNEGLDGFAHEVRPELTAPRSRPSASAMTEASDPPQGGTPRPPQGAVNGRADYFIFRTAPQRRDSNERR